MSEGWLLDTNVVGELVKGARADRAVLDWIDGADEDRLYLSVVTIGEMAKGIGLAEARGRDMSLQRQFLFHLLPDRFGSRILAFDTAAALVWGQLLQRLRGNREEERRLALDGQIAATAQNASLGVCTRNVRDFERLGVSELVSPFSTA